MTGCADTLSAQVFYESFRDGDGIVHTFARLSTGSRRVQRCAAEYAPGLTRKRGPITEYVWQDGAAHDLAVALGPRAVAKMEKGREYLGSA